MRPAIITALSSVAFAIGGWAMPIVVPKVDPWIAQGMLWVAGGLLAIAVLLWLWGLRKPIETVASPQTADRHGRNYAAGGNMTVLEGVTESPAMVALRDKLAQNALDRLAADEERQRRENEAIRRSREWQQTAYPQMHVPEADTPVAEAIIFLELGYWGGIIANLYDYEPERRKLAYRRFETFAKLGKLTIWGTLQGTHERKIPASAWRTFELDEDALENNEARTSPRVGKTASVIFSDLMTSRVQLENLKAQNDRS